MPQLEAKATEWDYIGNAGTAESTRTLTVEHARIKGEYYRDMSLHYPEYTTARSWPDHPFPNESYANMGAFGAQ